MNDVAGGPFARALVIANPKAGSVTEELVDDVARRCAKHVDQVGVRWTRAVGDAARMAAAQDGDPPDVVVSIGGDGTVREVVTGLVTVDPARRPTLLVVPGGTGNSNYLAHWGDTPWADSLDAALGGVGSRVRRLDLARLAERDELVLLGACSGIVAEALQVARTIDLAGRQLYQEAFTRVTRTCTPYPGRVTVDGRVVHEGGTYFANVGGGRFRGGTYKLLPHSLLDDGELDVCVVGEGVDPLGIPALIRDGGHVGLPGVAYARGRRIRIERLDGRPLWFEHDGELLDRVASAFTLDVVPGALPVLCGATSATG